MKTKPYMFLLLLLFLLIFILGIRYGQKVEKTNKTINYLISLPPTQPPEPTLSKKFISYIHSSCGISFFYPAWLTKTTETTTSATFSEKKEIKLFFSCDKNPVPSPSIPVQSNVTYFHKKDNTGKKTISFALDISLLPLIEKTFEFISPTP